MHSSSILTFYQVEHIEQAVIELKEDHKRTLMRAGVS